VAIAPPIIPGANPMFSEQQLVSQWRQLPSDRQQEVIDFVAFLAQRSDRPQPSPQTSPPPRNQFQQLRDNIIAAGIPLLSDTEIEQEVADRRGGYQETAS
jgi:hypothetical protein